MFKGAISVEEEDVILDWLCFRVFPHSGVSSQ